MTKNHPPIEFKSDGDADPVEIVTKALDDLSKAVDDRLKKLETKTDDKAGDKGKKDSEIDVKALSDRLDKNLILKAMTGHVADYEL